MAIVDADCSCHFWWTNTLVNWLSLRVGGQPALSLHSSNEPGKLSQWLCHDDSTINIISVIIIITFKVTVPMNLSRPVVLDLNDDNI